MKQENMNPKQQIIQKLRTLTTHHYIEILTKGNDAIWSALHTTKKTILIPEEGGWLTYQTYPHKLNLKLTKVKCHNAIIDLEDLKSKSKTADALIYQNPGGYHAEQPAKQIYQICKKNNCLTILDASGAIGTKLCQGKHADIILASFGRWKLIDAKTGGFISCQDEKIFNQIKSSFKILNDKNKLEIINEKINHLSERIKFLLTKRNKIIKDLKDYQIINQTHLGFVLIVKFTTDPEKEKIINYCKNNHLEYTECPRYIRLNQKAISIEVKRLEGK